MQFLIRFLLIPLLLSATPFILKAQESIWLRGKITNSQINEPMPFANIGIEGKSFGTVTNDHGIFELYIPPKYISDSLSFSFVGFKTLKIPIANLKDSVMNVKLQPESVLLDEVLAIHDNESFSRNLVRKAGQKIGKNYGTNLHLMQGFYRGLHTQNGVYVNLEEAAISIQTGGYKKHIDETLVRVDQLRKSEDGRVVEWKSALFNWLWGDNALFKLLLYDPLKTKNSPVWFHESKNYFRILYKDQIVKPEYDYQIGNYVTIKDKQNIDYFDYRTTALTMVDGEQAYVVQFKNDRNEYTQVEGTIIIGRSSLAILSYDYKFYFRPEYLKQQGVVMEHDGLIVDYSVQYKRSGKKYYLHLLRLKSLGDEKSPFAGDKNKGKIYQEKTLLITEVFEKRSTFEKMKNTEALHRDTPISFADTPFKPEFWQAYNILPDPAINEKVLKNLAQQKLSKEQFDLNQ